MPTTLKFQSFALSNIRERSSLLSDALAGASVLQVASNAGYAASDIVYVGDLGREDCEKAVILSVSGANTVTLTAPLGLKHKAFSAVTSVLGGHIRIYRAINVNDLPPALNAFSVFATRVIDADQPDTYYTDSTGSANYWYRYTYFNETTLAETVLDEFWPMRGDDFGHYASLDLIRKEAGFENATRLSDVDVDVQRRAAEAEINSKLGSFFPTVPFVKPVPDIIRTITIKLAAGLLLNNAYGETSKAGAGRIGDARDMIESLQTRQSSTGDLTNAVGTGVSGDFGDKDDGRRMFNIGDMY